MRARLISLLLLAVLIFSAAGASLKDASPAEVNYALRDDNGDARPDALGQMVTLRGILTLRP